MPEYLPASSEIIVNTVINANQIRPTVTNLPNGGYVVIWQTNDTTQDGSSSGLKGQIFDAAGNKVGAEFLVNSATVGGQQNADVTVLANGNFVVTWDSSDPLQDGSGFSVKAQVYSSAGVKIGSEFLVNTTTAGDQSVAEVAALANGGFVITWADWSGDFDQFAQVFDAQGAKVGTQFKVNAASAGLEDSGEVVGLSNGTFLVTWRTTLPLDGNLSSVMGRLFNADGTPVGAQFVVNTQATGSQTTPTATALENGNFVVAWVTDNTAQDGSGSAIKAQLFAANGTKIGGEFLINTQASGSQSEPRVSELPGGGFIVTWRTGDTLQDGFGSAIKAQVFDASGTKVGGEFLVNQWSSGDQSTADVSTLANGDVVITWTSVGADGSGSAISSRIFSESSPTTIVSNGGGETAAISVDENGLNVTTVVATSGGSAIQYSITGGADAALFSIDGVTGALSFIVAPDFEAPGDAGADNVYDVVVSASDGTLSDSQAIAVTVTSGNDAPVFQGSPTLSVGENSLIAGTVLATDPENDPLTYSITGGADAARFTINAQTGALTFVSAPNYEQPLDANADNVFNITVAASDGTLSSSRALSITVTDVNEQPVFVSSNNVIIPENYAISYQIQAVDPDSPAAALTYAIAGGADAARFTINAATGHISFLSTPNFEVPTDAGANNIYNVTVSVTDGVTIAQQSVIFQIYNVNEAPIISSNGGGATASLSISEGSTAVTVVASSDADGTTPTYSITGGADANLFAINSVTGALSFVSAPNYEAPADAGANNVYNVIVTATDGSLSDSQALSIAVTNVNEAPVITTGDTFQAVENDLAVGTIGSLDPEGTARTYSIVGGADAALFTIDAATGALSFVTAPDYEAPGDADQDNAYQVTVQASDGSLSTAQNVTVTVGNANEAPSVTSPASFAIGENGTAIGTVETADPEGTVLSYSITGGADAALFAIDPVTGTLSFLSAPDFEAPADGGADNVYDLQVSASDGSNVVAQNVTVTVDNVNEGQVVPAGQGAAVAEGSTAAGTFTASDIDGNTLAYAIVGGADAALFSIDAVTGAVSFLAAPDHEAPGDAGGDNVYDLVISASDGSIATTGSYQVQVGNVNEGPSITSNGGGASANVSLAEGSTSVTTVTSTDPEGDARTYSIVGGADAARFTIDALTGALSLIAAPDHEAPTDSDGDDVYDVIIGASDGSLIDTQALAVAISDVNEAPTITSNGGGASAALAVAENTTSVTTVSSTDPEGTARTYSIVGGADAARFTINAATGALSFIAPPNYEAASDAGGDNIYDVIVAASDGTLTDTQALAIMVTNANDAPTITSNGGGDTASVTVNENTTAVTTVTSTDPEGTARTYSIVGGSDAARFTINATTGVLSFVAAPNYEAPTDSNGDNVYNVIVQSSDGSLVDTQALAVAIGNVTDGSTITGTNSANTMTGTTAEDTIDGRGGNDTITGGLGADVLTGGSGADRFVFNTLNDSTLAGPDRITDFTLSQNDRIQLSGIDANASLAGDQAFSWIGTGNFTNVAGQLRYYQQNGHTYVTGDVNGDGVGDFLIQLDPAVTLSASYFLL